MKKIAILVIAAINKPVYVHYIKSYWTAVIRHTNAQKPNIDVYLLLENGMAMEVFKDIADNVIMDENSDLDALCDPEFQTPLIPGILSKTIFALEVLHDRYDVFFRTNLSSMIKISAFEEFVESRESICYSGAWTWTDSLRKDLVHHGKIGPEKSIKSLEELDDYEGNTFVSGAGYFLNSDEARSLVEKRDRIRYDIADDVSVGLMLRRHEQLDRFSAIVTHDKPPDDIVATIRSPEACHIRLEYFPPRLARAVWYELRDDPVWR
ncbi:MAG: hypothetical protein NXI27_17730 [Alphaproteobacteria bacterium]|nr:hypothetical protein [Alphaproteobacteria bacterium]